MLILINLNNYEFKFDENKEMFFTDLEKTKLELENSLAKVDLERLLDPYYDHKLKLIYLWAGSKTQIIYGRMLSIEEKEQERVMTFEGRSYLVTNEIKDVVSDENKIYWKTEDLF